MSALWIVLCVLLDAYVGYRIAKVLFTSKEGFLDALRYWFQPWWLSLLRGEFDQDFRESVKVWLVVAGPLALLMVQYSVLSALGAA